MILKTSKNKEVWTIAKSLFATSMMSFVYASPVDVSSESHKEIVQADVAHEEEAVDNKAAEKAKKKAEKAARKAAKAAKAAEKKAAKKAERAAKKAAKAAAKKAKAHKDEEEKAASSEASTKGHNVASDYAEEIDELD